MNQVLWLWLPNLMLWCVRPGLSAYYVPPRVPHRWDSALTGESIHRRPHRSTLSFIFLHCIAIIGHEQTIVGRPDSFWRTRSEQLVPHSWSASLVFWPLLMVQLPKFWSMVCIMNASNSRDPDMCYSYRLGLGITEVTSVMRDTYER